MKRTVKLFGIIAAVAVIGFSMAACDNNGGGGGVPSALVGTWEGTNNFEIRRDSEMYGGVGLFLSGGGATAIEARGSSIYELMMRTQIFDFSISGNTLTVSNSVGMPWAPSNGTYTRGN